MSIEEDRWQRWIYLRLTLSNNNNNRLKPKISLQWPIHVSWKKKTQQLHRAMYSPPSPSTPHHTPLCHVDLPWLGWSILSFCASRCPVGITRCRLALLHIIKQKKKREPRPPTNVVLYILLVPYPGKKIGIQIACKISLFSFASSTQFPSFSFF